MDGIDLIAREIGSANNIFVAGNGGSAAIASHFVCDLLRLTRVRAFSLVDNAALITMIANDYGYEQVFSYQIERLAGPGDALILISTSGGSPNVLRAAQAGEGIGARVVTLTGMMGASLGSLAHTWVRVPGQDAPDIENNIQRLLHAVCERLRDGS